MARVRSTIGWEERHARGAISALDDDTKMALNVNGNCILCLAVSL